MKLKQSLRKQSHYRIIKYYSTRSNLYFPTLHAAMQYIKISGITTQAQHYTELYHMKNETQGEQVGIWENSQHELKQVKT